MQPRIDKNVCKFHFFSVCLHKISSASAIRVIPMTFGLRKLYIV